MSITTPPSEASRPAPVPGRARRDGWTPERQARFLEALGQCGIVSAAATAAGMSRKSAYALRRRAGEGSTFARAWDAAITMAEGTTLALALDRCLMGEATPVFYRGRQVGERRRFDDRLLIAALRAMAARGHGLPALNGSSTPKG